MVMGNYCTSDPKWEMISHYSMDMPPESLQWLIVIYSLDAPPVSKSLMTRSSLKSTQTSKCGLHFSCSEFASYNFSALKTSFYMVIVKSSEDSLLLKIYHMARVRGTPIFPMAITIWNGAKHFYGKSAVLRRIAYTPIPVVCKEKNSGTQKLSKM